MRGNPARTAFEKRLQSEVDEYILTSKAGLSRRDIHGEDRRGWHVERRHDVAATGRRVLAACGRRRVLYGLCVAVGINAAVASVRPSYASAMVASVFAVALTAAYVAPDYVFEPPAPKATATSSSTSGMSVGEYRRRVAIHGEREELREEKIERERKRQERQSKATRGRF